MRINQNTRKISGISGFKIASSDNRGKFHLTPRASREKKSEKIRFILIAKESVAEKVGQIRDWNYLG
jgi:hypothetical protein